MAVNSCWWVGGSRFCCRSEGYSVPASSTSFPAPFPDTNCTISPAPAITIKHMQALRDLLANRCGCNAALTFTVSPLRASEPFNASPLKQVVRRALFLSLKKPTGTTWKSAFLLKSPQQRNKSQCYEPPLNQRDALLSSLCCWWDHTCKILVQIHQNQLTRLGQGSQL